MKKKIKIDYNLEEHEVDIGGVRKLTLNILRKSKIPMYINELVDAINNEFIGSDKESVVSVIKSLVIEGYDIKEISHGKRKLYALVRYASMDEKKLYRMHGDIQTPTIHTSDWHLGSNGFYKLGFNKLLKDIKKYDIQSVCIAGDLIQGRGVYSTELSELLMPKLGDQIGYAVELLNEIDIDVHLISGNHEEKVQGSVHIGLEPLKLVANACDNVHYYGHVANLTLNDEYHYMMMHGSGAVTQSTSQMIEKIWRGLRSKPNLLHCGHAHQSAFVRKDVGMWSIMSGSLQRSNTWLLQKGHTSKVGWWILKDIPDPETIELIDRTITLN